MSGPRRSLGGLVRNVGRLAWWTVATARPGVSGPRRGLLGHSSTVRTAHGGTVRIGRRFVGDSRVFLSSRGELVIGDDVFINSDSRVIAHRSVVIGDRVLFGSHVSVLDHDHHVDDSGKRLDISKSQFDIAPVRIGCDVWLGDKVTVVAGVTIGDNVIVGANSVVTRDIEPWTLVAGAPARVIRRLGPMALGDDGAPVGMSGPVGSDGSDGPERGAGDAD